MTTNSSAMTASRTNPENLKFFSEICFYTVNTLNRNNYDDTLLAQIFNVHIHIPIHRAYRVWLVYVARLPVYCGQLCYERRFDIMFNILMHC